MPRTISTASATAVARRPRARLALALLLLALAALALPPGRPYGASPEGDALLREVDRVLQPDAYEMYRKLINIEPDGSRKEFVLYSLKKGKDKVIALFLSPASDKGRVTLRLGDNMWLYIPNVGKPIRITSLQSVTGGVFNNADILRLDFAVEYEAERLEDAGKQHLLLLKAKTGAVAYDRLKMWVDRQRKVPTRIEAYAASGLLIKTLYYKEPKDLGDGVVRPSVVETDSPLYKGYKSVMIWAKVKPRPLADELFTLDAMGRIDVLR
ncbi:MAG: outer membrane lipoprotein-sorting protein [Candidatus Lambdaproteobacteria bacterium]|nr:outer membrane lipoprotein-sorting protein [Candidatus Lambdaproteobacteria bacterium]